MSGPIRSQIGPAKANLVRHLNDAQTHLNQRPEQNASADTWTQWIQILKNDHLRIQGAINRIDTQIQRWTQLLIQLEGPEREAENTLYNDVSNEANSFVAKTEEGHEMSAVLTSNIEIGENALRNHNNAPPNHNNLPPNHNNALQNNQNNGNPNNAQPNNQNNHRARQSVQVRLPKNNLPEFEGDVSLWPSFWDAFTSAIHSNTDLSDIDRFNYLHGCLKGEAKRLIQGYFVTSANYALAINKLRDRYGDEERIKSDLRYELQQLPSAGTFIQSIRRTFDDMERIMLQLEQLGEDVNQTFVLSAIEAKMPKWILVELEKAKINMREKLEETEPGAPFEWNSSKVFKCLAKIVRLHESVNKIHTVSAAAKEQKYNFKTTDNTFKKESASNTRVFVSNAMDKGEEAQIFASNSGQNTKKGGPRNQNYNTKPNKGPQSSFQQPEGQFKPFGREFSSSKNANFQPLGQPSRRSYPCVFCLSDRHSSTNCDKYFTGEARQKRLAIFKKCFNCFKDNSHEKCMDTRKCTKCNGQHKDIVCGQFKLEKKNENVQNHSFLLPLASENAQLNNMSTKKPEMDILLMTQNTTVKFKNNSPPVRGVRIFLDPGASRSFITNRLAQGMFGHKTSFTSRQINVQLELKAEKGKSAPFREFKFRTTSKITDKIEMPIISNEIYKNLEKEMNGNKFGLTTKMEEVDILIGMEYFWDLVISKKKLKSGFYLIETMIGPIICGGKIKENANAQNSANFMAKIETEKVLT